MDGVPNPNPMQVLVGQIIATGHDAAPGYLVTVVDLTVKPEDRTDQPLLYLYGRDELECVDCGGIILRTPFTAGHSWPLAEQGTPPPQGGYRITADDAEVDVSERRFSHCLIVEIDEPAADLLSEITYAPDIGPIRMRYRHPSHPAPLPFREEDLTDFRISIPPHLPQAVGRG